MSPVASTVCAVPAHMETEAVITTVQCLHAQCGCRQCGAVQ